jgi:hypothetical protein
MGIPVERGVMVFSWAKAVALTTRKTARHMQKTIEDLM